MKILQEQIPNSILFKNAPETWHQQIVTELGKTQIDELGERRYFYTSDDLNSSYLQDLVHFSIKNSSNIPFMIGSYLSTQTLENAIQENGGYFLKDQQIFIIRPKELSTLKGYFSAHLSDFLNLEKLIHIDINTLDADIVNNMVKEDFYPDLDLKNSTLSVFGKFSKLQPFILNNKKGNEKLNSFDLNLDGRNESIGNLIYQILFCLNHYPGKNLYITIEIEEDYFKEVARLRALKFFTVALKSFLPNSDIQNIFILGFPDFRLKEEADHFKVLKASTSAMALIQGGAQGIILEDLQSLDEVYRNVLHNITLILTKESYLNIETDPYGGAFYIEKLTEDFIKQAWEEYNKTESRFNN